MKRAVKKPAVYHGKLLSNRFHEKYGIERPELFWLFFFGSLLGVLMEGVYCKFVHGGCSPVGMKKQFPTFVQETAKDYETFYVSAGKVGVQVELAAEDLGKVVRLRFADVTIL